MRHTDEQGRVWYWDEEIPNCKVYVVTVNEATFWSKLDFISHRAAPQDTKPVAPEKVSR